jgi:small conductance mechanosensitive channel
MDWKNYFSADSFNAYVIPWAINIVFALGIFIIGRWVAFGLTGVLRRILIKAKMDDILVEFICTIARVALLLFVVIAALEQFGVDTTSLIALLGAAGLAVGLAMQNSLSNFAAGVMLIVFHPFRAGDYVEAGGTSGTVEKISIFSTVLRTPDNREVIVPNGNIYGSNIVNFSARDTRRVDLVFGIGYGDDIRQARDIIQSILAQDDRILKDPEPVVAVGELGANSVDFVVRPWVATADYWNVRWDLLEKIKLAFDEQGVSIPYPQRDVHLYQHAVEEAD